MKKSNLMLSLLCVCLSYMACQTKEDNTPTTIIGTWEAIASYGSDGANGYWTDIAPADRYTLHFIDSTQFSTTQAQSPSCTGQWHTNQDTLFFTFPCQPTPQGLNIISKLEGNELILSLIGCDEGCMTRFRKR